MSKKEKQEIAKNMNAPFEKMVMQKREECAKQIDALLKKEGFVLQVIPQRVPETPHWKFSIVLVYTKEAVSE